MTLMPKRAHPTEAMQQSIISNDPLPLDLKRQQTDGATREKFYVEDTHIFATTATLRINIRFNILHRSTQPLPH